jgi:hypothetical protein
MAPSVPAKGLVCFVLSKKMWTNCISLSLWWVLPSWEWCSLIDLDSIHWNASSCKLPGICEVNSASLACLTVPIFTFYCTNYSTDVYCSTFGCWYTDINVLNYSICQKTEKIMLLSLIQISSIYNWKWIWIGSSSIVFVSVSTIWC